MNDKSHRVVAAVVRRGNEVLVCKRPVHKRHGGLWEFPGGKCEPGETDAEALARELQEELRLRLTSTGRELLVVHDPGSTFQIAFIEVTVDGEPQCVEHEAYLWCAPQELAAISLAPSDLQFVNSTLRVE